MGYKHLKQAIYFLSCVLLFVSCSPSHQAEEVWENDCAFCKEHILDAQKFYEDDLTVALYTHKPIVPGHCLVIPKRHVKYYEDLTDAEIFQIAQTVKKVHLVVQKVFHTSAYLLLQKNGRQVGQTVPHVHIHYVPRGKEETSIPKFILQWLIANIKRPLAAEAMQGPIAKLSQEMDALASIQI